MKTVSILSESSKKFLCETADQLFDNATEPEQILPLIQLLKEAGLKEKAAEIKDAWIEGTPSAKMFFEETDDSDFSEAMPVVYLVEGIEEARQEIADDYTRIQDLKIKQSDRIKRALDITHSWNKETLSATGS